MLLTKEIKCCMLKTKISLTNSRVLQVILSEKCLNPGYRLFASPQKFLSICKSLLSLVERCSSLLDALWPSLLGEVLFIAAEAQASVFPSYFDVRGSLPVVCTPEYCKVEWKIFSLLLYATSATDPSYPTLYPTFWVREGISYSDLNMIFKFKPND